MSKRSTWRNRLEPFGDLVYQMSTAVRRMSPRDLLQLENACKKTSQTNIGWAEYRAAQVIAPLIREERCRRKKSAPAGKTAGNSTGESK